MFVQYSTCLLYIRETCYLETAQVLDAAGEGGVSALGDGHVRNAADKFRRLAHRS
jgi:hypothetical protein